jgi:polyphenol oxidase
MERRELGSGAHAMVSTALEARGFLAVFTERTGGVSPAPYDTLNLGLRTGDAPEHVMQNRRRLIGALGVSAFAAGEQVHGAQLSRVEPHHAGAGFESFRTAIGGVDALSVSGRNLPVAVMVADCVPIALGSPQEHRLVVVHAGWRGMATGVLSRAVAEFHRPSGVLAAIGPAIGPCHYEVHDDVALAVASGTEGGAVTVRRNGRRYLDLPGTAARSIRASGVRHVEVSDLCTACLPDRFFSHRRDGVAGRQALLSVMV